MDTEVSMVANVQLQDGEMRGPAHSTPGATCARWRGESQGSGVVGSCSAVYQLGKRAGGGAREPPAAAWTLASCLLGNQESQAQLIKCWAMASQGAVASAVHRSLVPQPSPDSRQATGWEVQLGTSFPS